MTGFDGGVGNEVRVGIGDKIGANQVTRISLQFEATAVDLQRTKRARLRRRVTFKQDANRQLRLPAGVCNAEFPRAQRDR